MSADVDLAVLGAGPAGSAAALTFCHRHPAARVVVFERSHFRATRIGETVPPIIAPILEQLGAWEAFTQQGHLPAPGAVAAWGSEQLTGHEFIFNRFGVGWHLDRSRFDEMLADRARIAGAQVQVGVRAAVEEETADGWRVRVDSRSGQAQSISASVVIDASGRHSPVAVGAVSDLVTVDTMFAATAILPTGPSALPTPGTVVEAVEDGWWYSSPVPGDRVVVSFMGDRDEGYERWRNATFWSRRLAATQHQTARVDHHVRPSHVRMLDASSTRRARCVGRRWLAAGNAAVALDPLSSQGVVSAMRTGIYAAFAASDMLSGVAGAADKYARWLADGFDTYLRDRASFYRAEQRWPSEPFWRRRHVAPLLSTQPARFVQSVTPKETSP